MGKEEHINFTKEAFKHPINLGMLLVSAITALLLSSFTGVPLALLSIVFGFELMYLGIVPRLPRYRKDLKMRSLRDQDPHAEKQSIFEGLTQKSRKQFLVLKYLQERIKENFDSLPYSSQGLLESIREKVDGLVSSYLTMLDRYKRYQMYMNTSVEESLKEEVEEEKKHIDTINSERLKRTKIRRLKILKKRLKKFEIAKEKYLVCETHLETIEDAVHYIHEQSMTMNNAEDIGFQLDNLLEEVEETSQLINNLDVDIFPHNSALDDLNLDSEVEELNFDPEQTATKSGVTHSSQIKE